MTRVFGILTAVVFVAVSQTASAQIPKYSSELLKRAEDGDALAQYDLSYAYYMGSGVVQDFVYAHMWVNISASLGAEQAIRVRELLTKEMTPEQLAEAQKLARECVRKEYKDC